jgi:hypothetical protein
LNFSEAKILREKCNVQEIGERTTRRRDERKVHALLQVDAALADRVKDGVTHILESAGY